MKKLMFAAAMIAAGAAMAVDSDIVGYQNVGFADGKKYVGAPFTTIGQATEGLLLTELIPTGYEDNADLLDVVINENDGYLAGDEFSFYIVNPNGSISAEYGWSRSYDINGSKWNDDGAWSKISGATDIVRFAPGEGLYTTCNYWTDGCGFLTAGNALVDARNIPFKSGKFMMSNPLSATVALNKFWPVGYEDNADLLDVVINENDGYLAGDEFSFYIVNPNGSIKVEYGWSRSYDIDNSQWNNDGEWSKISGASEIVGIESGDAIYTNCNYWDDDCGISFPGIDDSRVE